MKQGAKSNLQLVCVFDAHRSLASGLDGSRSIDLRTHDDSNAVRVRPDKILSERERGGKLAY
jgi:hypothetical protein